MDGAITGSEELIRQVGIFDTLGYKEYTNSSELVFLIENIEDLNPLVVDDRGCNRLAPLYLVLPRIKTDSDSLGGTDKIDDFR